MKILLLGKSGMLGSRFLEILTNDSSFKVSAPDDLDITNSKALSETFGKDKPNIVINCAAYTNVDDCEKNEDLAFQVNGFAVGEIAKLCKIHNSILIHFSTDYVFDGKKSGGYNEDDLPNPINAYGRSKLEGEKLIQENMSRFFIIRTSWLFGQNGVNFVDKMIELAEKNTQLNVVDDQVGSPTYTSDLALAVVENFLKPQVNGEKIPPFGTYHLTNSGNCSWNQFAREIFILLNKYVTANKVSSEKFPRPAKRPKISILINTKLPPLRSWREALKSYLELKF